jgi:23S rRNA (uracil1939-C5)-methyltransferase
MTLTIARLGHLGDGIAETEAGPVFVPFTLPGEVVEGEIDGDRMAAPKVVTPSALRVKAPCAHFRTCGGCALQHVADGFVAEWKAGIVAGALKGQGLEADIRPTLTSAPATRRRATLAGRRTKKGALVGFHARASDMVVAVPDCRLLIPGIMAALPGLEELVKLAASRKGELALAVTATEAGLDVDVSDAKEITPQDQMALGPLAAAHGFARITWNGEVAIQRAPPLVHVGRVAVSPPAGAFLQATAEAEAALTEFVRDAVRGAAKVADLFCGLGTFTLPLAEAAEVHGVENDRPALDALDRARRGTTGLKAITTEARDLFRRPLLTTELARFDAVVLDPPRAGADAQVRELAASTVPTIAYVSCNPVTFARDARVLVAGGYRLEHVQPVDQFRWSPHVELAARFTRPDIGRT